MSFTHLLVFKLRKIPHLQLHHVSPLFVHPSRRVRLLSVTLHASLLHIPDVYDQVILFLRETASTDQIESILGTWCMAAHDVDRQVSSYAIRSWNEVVSISEQDQSRKLVLTQDLCNCFLSFVQRAVLDPAGAYLYLNPLPPAVVPTPPRKVSGRSAPVVLPKKEDAEQSRSKAEDEVENEQDRKARLRVGAFGALKWILGE
jgi:hypothetical protein